jgi:hypothetical protein
MNRLENDAESSLIRLIEGQSGRFTAEEISTVTRWVAKTAFVMEHMDPSPKAASRDQLEAVRAGEAVPRFHAFMLPVEPNVTYRTRSTEWHSKEDPSHGTMRISSIHFYQVLFVAVTFQDEEAASLVDVSQADDLLGRPTGTLSDGLEWPDREPWPVRLLPRLHDRVAGINLHSPWLSWDEISPGQHAQPETP